MPARVFTNARLPINLLRQNLISIKECRFPYPDFVTTAGIAKELQKEIPLNFGNEIANAMELFQRTNYTKTHGHIPTTMIHARISLKLPTRPYDLR